METKIVAAIAVTLLLFGSCKNHESTEASEGPRQVEANDSFKVTLDVVVKKDDNFQVYYTESPSETFNEKQSVWMAVKGMDKLQKVVLELPKDVVPNLIRLDFGLNPDQGEIILSEVDLNYFGKTFIAKGAMIGNYFRPLSPTIFNIETGSITAVGSDGKRIEPVLYPQEIPLSEEIEKLIR